MTLALTRSRWARDLKTIQEKKIVSPRFILKRRGKGAPPISRGGHPQRSMLVMIAILVALNWLVASEETGPSDRVK